MIAEAIDTATRIGWALLGWIVFFATIGSVLILAAVATGVWGVSTARNALSARLAPEQPAGAPRLPSEAPTAPEGPSRPAPSWARTDHDHQEAA